jgi:hypothetical protein
MEKNELESGDLIAVVALRRSMVIKQAAVSIAAVKFQSFC